MRYILVEDYSKDFDYSQGQIVALTPEACYELKRHGHSYRLLEDYYHEDDLASEFGEDFFKEQLQWFNDFEQYLFQRIAPLSEEKPRLINYQYYQLKYIIDSFIVASFAWRKFIETTKPSVIDYLTQIQTEQNHWVYVLELNDRRFFKPTLKRICQQHQITLNEIKVLPAKSSNVVIDTARIPSKTLQGSPQLRRFLKSVYFDFKYQKFHRFFKPDPRFESLSCLFLHGFDRNTGGMLKDFLKKGAKVYLKEENQILAISSLVHQPLFDLKKEAAPIKEKMAFSMESTALDFQNHPELLSWINQKAGCDLTDFLQKSLSHFISTTCLDIMAEFVVMKSFFQKYGIQYVAARGGTEKDVVSALMAAEAAQVKRVCFQHGADSRASIVAIKSESDPFDIYFAMEEDSKQQMEEAKRYPFIKSCQVFQYPDFLGKLGGLKQRRVHRRPEIVYLTSRPTVSLRMLNQLEYPTAWYFDFQRSLIDYFGQCPEKDFIFKYVERRSDWMQDSILPYLTDKKYPNVRRESRPFVGYLKTADGVIMDFPGTAMYEAAAAGIPLLVLCHRRIENRPQTMKLFGKSLQLFSSTEEALHSIARFFSENPENYIVSLSLTDQDASEKLIQCRTKD